MRDDPFFPARSTWHAGEKAIQQTVGVAERMEAIGPRLVHASMPDQHRDFFARLPFIVAGSVDHQGDPWATLFSGSPGFITSPTPTALEIDTPVEPSDPAADGLRDGDAIGLLGIELHTRRRNRANGTVRARSPHALQLDIGESFGNCPKYIQLREPAVARDARAPSEVIVEENGGLDAAARAAITAADTFFVASYADVGDRRQVDVSHRGGKSGFVRIGADGLLTIPDFSGNLFFMTLGNIKLNGRAGLLFVDFATGDLLQLTGDAAIVLDSPEIAAFQGAERLWTFRARRVVRRRNAVGLRWASRADGMSPNARMTGNWNTAVATR